MQTGAYADLILVESNPLENIDLIADPQKNFVVIMKAERSARTTFADPACPREHGRNEGLMKIRPVVLTLASN